MVEQNIRKHSQENSALRSCAVGATNAMQLPAESARAVADASVTNQAKTNLKMDYIGHGYGMVQRCSNLGYTVILEED